MTDPGISIQSPAPSRCKAPLETTASPTSVPSAEPTESLASEYNAKCDWNGDELAFSSTGVKGKLHIAEDEVEIKVDLGLVFRPLKSKIESGIVAQLDDIIGDKEHIA